MSSSDKEQKFVEINIARPLAERQYRHYLLKIAWKWSPQETTVPKFESFELVLVREEKRIAPLLWVECEECSEKEEDEKFLCTCLCTFLENCHNSESHVKRILFDRLRDTLQHVHFDNIYLRSELLTKWAHQFTMADMSVYYEFKGLDNALNPLFLIRDKELQKDEPHEEKEACERAKEKLTGLMKDWANDIKNNRKKSSAYRCIDTPQIVSRFISKEVEPPFASYVENEVNTNKIPDDWFKDEQDVLAVPIMFHGRKQGVLHLYSINKCHFLHQDRLLLLSFVQMFEAELFEARMTATLQKINSTLGEVLNEERSQERLCNNLSNEVSDLLGAAGVSLWWRTNLFQSYFELLGRAGKQIESIFKMRTKINAENDPFFSDLSFKGEIQFIDDLYERGPIGEKIHDTGIRSCIRVPMIDDKKNIMGIMLVHDRGKNTDLLEPIMDKIEFFAQHIKQLLLHYKAYKGEIDYYRQEIRNVRNLIGHDVYSMLRSIDGSRHRLASYKEQLSAENQEIYCKQLEDIKSHIKSSYDLIDILTTDKLQREFKSRQKAPFIALMRYLKLKGPLEKPTDIYEIINSVLHASSKKLQEKNIRFENVSKSSYSFNDRK